LLDEFIQPGKDALPSLQMVLKCRHSGEVNTMPHNYAMKKRLQII
jgi:hypothetical protein